MSEVDIRDRDHSGQMLFQQSEALEEMANTVLKLEGQMQTLIGELAASRRKLERMASLCFGAGTSWGLARTLLDAKEARESEAPTPEVPQP